MSKAARGGFFDDDEDDAPESYNTAAATNADDSLSSNFAASVSPQRNWPAARQQRDSSLGTGTGGAGRVSSVTGAAAGSSTRGGGGYDTTSRGDSPSLDDILGDSGASKEKGRNVQKLLRAYANEVGAPELLLFPRELVERVVWTLAQRVRSSLPLIHFHSLTRLSILCRKRWFARREKLRTKTTLSTSRRALLQSRICEQHTH